MATIRNVLTVFIFLFCFSVSASAESLVSFKEAGLQLSLSKIHSGFELAFDGKSKAEPKVFSLENPSRLVVDLPGYSISRSRALPISGSDVKSVRLGVHPDKVRVVVDIKSAQVPEFVLVKGADNATRQVSFALGQKPSVPRKSVFKASLQTSKEPPKPDLIQAKEAPAKPVKTIASLGKARTEEKAQVRPKFADVTEPVVEKDEPAPVKVTERAITPKEEKPEKAAKLNKPASEEKAAPAGDSVIHGLFFKENGDKPGPAVLVEVENFSGGYSFAKKNGNTYELVLEKTTLGNSHLSLPHFPPDSFVGLEVAVAEQAGSDVVVKIFVEDGIRLYPFRKQGQLWVKVVS